MRVTANQLAEFSVRRTADGGKEDLATAKPGWVYACESTVGAHVSARDSKGTWTPVSSAEYALTAKNFGLAAASPKLGGFDKISHDYSCADHMYHCEVPRDAFCATCDSCVCPRRKEWYYVGIPATGRDFRFESCSGSIMDAIWNPKARQFDVFFKYADGRTDCWYETLCKQICGKQESAAS